MLRPCLLIPHLQVSFSPACYNVNRFVASFPFCVRLTPVLLCSIYFDGAEIKDATPLTQLLLAKASKQHHQEPEVITSTWFASSAKNDFDS